MNQVNKLMDTLLSTAEMTDEECKAELESAGVDVAAAEKRMDAKFKNMLDSLKPGPAADKPEPPPTPGGHPVAAGVIEDMQKRVQFGLTKYGTMLHTNNGRDALMDAYQEALDLCMYLKQAIMERDAVKPVADRSGYERHRRGCPFWYDETEPGMTYIKAGAKCSCGLDP